VQPPSCLLSISLFPTEIHASVKLQEFEWENTFQSDKFIEEYAAEQAPGRRDYRDDQSLEVKPSFGLATSAKLLSQQTGCLFLNGPLQRAQVLQVIAAASPGCRNPGDHIMTLIAHCFSSHCQHKCRQRGAFPFQSRNEQRWEIAPISPRR
jgi:hypothetical protein